MSHFFCSSHRSIFENTIGVYLIAGKSLAVEKSGIQFLCQIWKIAICCNFY